MLKKVTDSLWVGKEFPEHERPCVLMDEGAKPAEAANLMQFGSIVIVPTLNDAQRILTYTGHTREEIDGLLKEAMHP